MNVLLLTDDADPGSVLPSLSLVAPAVRYAPLTPPQVGPPPQIVVVDGCTDMAAARRACRAVASAAPQVAAVAVVAPQDLVAVDLDWHADDVVLPTAGTAEVQARLRLAIARRRTATEETLTYGDLVLHPASYVASLPERDLELTLTEFKLLNFLVHNAGRAFTRTRLMHEVWGHLCGRRTVDVHVQRLRSKLGPEHEAIVDTVRGVGYMAASPPHRVAAPPTKIAAGQ